MIVGQHVGGLEIGSGRTAGNAITNGVGGRNMSMTKLDHVELR